MRKKASVYLMMVSALLVAFAIGTVTSLAQSRDTAIAVGKPIVTQINCGESVGGGEPYNATITLLELIRGPEALKRLQKAGDTNIPPDPGFDYIHARVKFEYYARRCRLSSGKGISAQTGNARRPSIRRAPGGMDRSSGPAGRSKTFA